MPKILNRFFPLLAGVLFCFWTCQNAYASNEDSASQPEIFTVLPGYADLYFDVARLLEEQFNVIPHQTEATGRRVPRVARAFEVACADLLKNPSSESRLQLATVARRYFGVRSSRRSPFAPFRVPSQSSRSSPHWFHGLARYLDSLPKPVRLVVEPSLLNAKPKDHSAWVQTNLGSGEVSLHISLVEHRWPPSIAVGHELFHVRQMQGQIEGSPDVWPRHHIRLPADGAFKLIDFYFKDPGYFFIEEIGSYLRDALEVDGNGSGPESSLQLAIAYLLVAKEFAEAADATYRQARSLWTFSGDKPLGEFKKGLESIDLSLGPDHSLHLSPPSTPGVSPTERWVSNELAIGHRWIIKYLAVLRLMTQQLILAVEGA